MRKDVDLVPTSQKLRPKRYSISVIGPIYDRLRELSEESTSLQKFVDGLIVSALDDPTIRDRVLGKCFQEEAW